MSKSFVVLSFVSLLTTTFLGGCMGSPGAGGGTGSGGGGFTGNPPPGSTPKSLVGSPNLLISSGGTISTSAHLTLRASFGEAPGGIAGSTASSSPNLQMRASLQPSLNDNPGL